MTDTRGKKIEIATKYKRATYSMLHRKYFLKNSQTATDKKNKLKN